MLFSGQFGKVWILDKVGWQSEELETKVVRPQKLRTAVLQNSGVYLEHRCFSRCLLSAISEAQWDSIVDMKFDFRMTLCGNHRVT